MVKPDLRAVDVARARLADVAMSAARNLDVARSDDIDVCGPRGVRFDISRTRYRDRRVQCLDVASLDVARTADRIID
jgi:hypothetical protein